MINKEYDHGYGVTWTDLHIISREGYHTSVSDFHEHDFFEINLVLSGNIKILLPGRMEQGTGTRMILTSPGTPHYIACAADTLYSRIYLMFSRDFVAEYVPEWKQLLTVFGTSGTSLSLTDRETSMCRELLLQIRSEQEPFRQRLLILYLLSRIAEIPREDDILPNKIPQYVMEALAFIEKNYSRKFTAAELARQTYIGRTTLMTAFRQYTGSTLGNYIRDCRLKHAIRLLGSGVSEQEAAERCGFCDSSSLIRSFRRVHGLTPGQYFGDKGK